MAESKGWRKWLAGGTLVALTIFLAAVPGPGWAKEIKELRIGIGVDADTLNPLEHTTAVPSNISALIHDALAAMTPEGKLVPKLAESWSASDDGLTWTMKLRKGVRFSDGSPFDAHALKAQFDALLNPQIRIPLRFIWGSLKEAVVLDDYTMEQRLKEPFAPYEQTFFFTQPLPRKALENYDAAAIRQNPIGAGPYKLAEWVKGDRIVLVRNENYWGPKPTVEKVIYQIVPDTTTRMAMLRAGQLDVAYSPTPVDVAALEADPNIKVVRPLSARMIFVGMNCQKGVTKDKRVRQAFNYAVDKKAIAKKVMFDTVRPLDAPAPPMLFGYSPMDRQYDYDPEKAKALLKEADFPKDAVIKLTTPVGRYANDRQIAETVQAYLQAIGVKVELRAYDWPTYMAMTSKPLDQTELELYLTGWGAPYLDVDFMLFMYFSSFVQPPRGLGSTFYTNPEFDKATAMARQILDPAKRKALYKQASEMLWDDAPAIWLHTEAYSIAHRSDIKGLEVLAVERLFPTYATRD
jgi:ABC-type transport system substrate-binding protein